MTIPVTITVVIRLVRTSVPNARHVTPANDLLARTTADLLATAIITTTIGMIIRTCAGSKTH
jgi:hypothetical protein